MVPTKNKVIPGTFDPIFKSILTGNKKYISDIISGVSELDKDEVLENIVFKNPEYVINNVSERRKTSDLVVEVKRNIINIEMNGYYYKKLYKRNEKYLSKLNTLYDDKDDEEDYKYIQINIDNFNKTDEVITKYVMMNVKTHEPDGNIIKYRVNLALIEQKYYNNEELTKLEKELLMLRIDDKEELDNISKGDEIMEEVYDNLKTLSEDKFIQLEYDLDEKIRYEATQVGLEEGMEQGLKQGLKQGLEQGIEQGIEQGLEKGSKEKSMEIAKNMLNKNMDIDLISELTNLSSEEIEEIKNEKN